MKLTSIQLQELNESLSKCSKVFNSCNNATQFNNADTFFSLLQLKYWKMFEDKVDNSRLMVANADFRMCFNAFKIVKNESILIKSKL